MVGYKEFIFFIVGYISRYLFISFIFFSLSIHVKIKLYRISNLWIKLYTTIVISIIRLSRRQNIVINK